MAWWDEQKRWSDQRGDQLARFFFEGAQVQQRNNEMAFRIRQAAIENSMAQKRLDLAEEQQNLIAKVINENLDQEISDARTWQQWIPRFNSATGETLRNLPVPTFKNPANITKWNNMVESKSRMDKYLQEDLAVRKIIARLSGKEWANVNRIYQQDGLSEMLYDQLASSEEAEAKKQLDEKLRLQQWHQDIAQTRAQSLKEYADRKFAAATNWAARYRNQAFINTLKTEGEALRYRQDSNPSLTQEEAKAQWEQFYRERGVPTTLEEANPTGTGVNIDPTDRLGLFSSPTNAPTKK